MTKCPRCNEEAHLYKELLDDGKAKVVCNKIGCNWESEPQDAHKLDMLTLNEKKQDWGIVP